MILPFVYAIFGAYTIEPVLRRMERWHVPRWLGAIVIAGGAGLSLGWSMVSPGRVTRIASLQAVAKRPRRGEALVEALHLEDELSTAHRGLASTWPAGSENGHAVRWPGAASTRAMSTSAHASRRNEQRGANGHPGGSASSRGGWPAIGTSGSRSSLGTIEGSDSIRPRV